MVIMDRSDSTQGLLPLEWIDGHVVQKGDRVEFWIAPDDLQRMSGYKVLVPSDRLVAPEIRPAVSAHGTDLGSTSVSQRNGLPTFPVGCGSVPQTIIDRAPTTSANPLQWEVETVSISVYLPFTRDASKGTISRWLRKDGETVLRGDALCHVRFARHGLTVTSPATGTVKIATAENTTVPADMS